MLLYTILRFCSYGDMLFGQDDPKVVAVWNRIPQYYRENMKRLAKRLIEINSEMPGSVRMRTNPHLIDAAKKMLSEMDFKKGFFQSSEQFVMSCFLFYLPAAEALMYRVLLANFSDEESKIHYWTGIGQYAGWHSGLGMFDFSDQSYKFFIFIVTINPFFDKISDLLDPINPELGSNRSRT